MINTLVFLLAVGIALLGAAWGVRAGTRRSGSRRGGAVFALLLCIAGSVVLAPAVSLAWFLLAGQPKPERRVLGPGVTYERRVFTQPRKNVAHIAEIDLNAGHRLALTAPVETPDGLRYRAKIPTEAMRELRADLLVNASFFGPFHDRHLLDYYPHAGDIVEPLGFAICNGRRCGTPKPKWVTFWCGPDGSIGFGRPPEDAACAVTGLRWLLREGKAPHLTVPAIHPRTVLGVDRTRRRLWLVVVDGRQPNYSLGMTVAELQPLLLDLGAFDAIELDGGGSSTMVVRGKGGAPVVLSRPIHTKFPTRERPVANCLGVIFPTSRS